MDIYIDSLRRTSDKPWPYQRWSTTSSVPSPPVAPPVAPPHPTHLQVEMEYLEGYEIATDEIMIRHMDEEKEKVSE